MSKGKDESRTNNLLRAILGKFATIIILLVWHSGDEDGLQSQRSGV